jgi:hypothetical protein
VCKKLVHHLCTINWGQNKGVTDDIGYTCREHTPAYIEISRQFNPQLEASENGSDHSDDNSHKKQNEKTIYLDDSDDNSPNAEKYSTTTEQPRGRKLPIIAARKNQGLDPPTNARSGTIFLRQVNTFCPVHLSFHIYKLSTTHYLPKRSICASMNCD